MRIRDSVKFLTELEINNLSLEQKIQYYSDLRDYCLGFKESPDISVGQRLISAISPIQRNFELEIEGEENLPSNGAIIVCNHSNSHDFFTALETFNSLDLPVSVFAANDDLNFLSNGIFSFANATLVDRNDKLSLREGFFELTGKVINNNYVVFFGESTWNLHPYRQMQVLKLGPARSALISGRLVVPTIFEYVEVPDLCSKEKQLYSKCIIKFGKPVRIDFNEDLSTQMFNIECIMSRMRSELWEKLGIFKAGSKVVDPIKYVNHTWLKKFDALAFSYDSESEFKYLYFRPDEARENEYHINENGLFVPGVTKKEDKARVILPCKHK